jgi:hypothetical protein
VSDTDITAANWRTFAEGRHVLRDERLIGECDRDPVFTRIATDGLTVGERKGKGAAGQIAFGKADLLRVEIENVDLHMSVVLDVEDCQSAIGGGSLIKAVEA